MRSPQAHEHLLKHLYERNRAASLSAPVNAILSFENNWHKCFSEFAPHAVAAQEFFENEHESIPLGRLNAQVQAGYFITAVRAIRLDAEPVTGADFDALVADPVLLDRADI